MRNEYRLVAQCLSAGAMTSPVVNFRFNESPVRMQGGESGMIAPPITVKDYPFTSVSDAV